MPGLKLEHFQNNDSVYNGGELVPGEVDDGVMSMGSTQPPYLLLPCQQGNSSGASMEDTITVACTEITDKDDDIWYLEFEEYMGHQRLVDMVC